MHRSGATGVFEWRGQRRPEADYRLRFAADGRKWERRDPYAFPPEPIADDLFLFAEGRLHQAYRTLGAHCQVVDGVAGVRFRVWAPNAERVSLVGDFNAWDGRRNPLANLGASGVWELFMPDLAPGTLYKFEIRHRGSGAILVKSDPYARQAEMRPGTASRVVAAGDYAWGDGGWLAARAAWEWQHAPVSIYEVHAGSWKRHPDGRFYSYRELAEHLVPYVAEQGFTHIEFMPLTEHPLDESWGYQTTGYFAPTARFGAPDELRHLVDSCHRAGIGVILDWVPGHFPEDTFALAHFDGSALYEHEDPRQG
jgi:1,4-alpha-glucan branching enzyme